MVSLIAVDSIISIFISVFAINVIIVIVIIFIAVIIMIPAVDDNPRPIDRGGRMVSEPRAFRRRVAVLCHSLLVGHIPGGGGDDAVDDDADT